MSRLKSTPRKHKPPEKKKKKDGNSSKEKKSKRVQIPCKGAELENGDRAGIIWS